MSDYEEFGYDMYVDKEREAEYLADTGLCGGFMRMTPVPPHHTPYGGYYHPQKRSIPSNGYRSKYPDEVKNDIFDTLTVKECQILNNVRYNSSKEDIEEYVGIIQKLINMGVFDDVPVDTHENVINRYGQMKINPCPSSTCGTCVACDNECDETESDCDDDDDQPEDDTSIVKKRELVLTDAFATRFDYNWHNDFMRRCADYEVTLSSDIGIDDSTSPVYYSSIFKTLTTMVRIRLEDVVDRTKAINMVMKFLSVMYDESNSTLVVYCDSDDACGLEDWISTVYNDKIRHNLMGVPDNICGIRMELPNSKMIAIPFVLHVMSYLWSDTDMSCK